MVKRGRKKNMFENVSLKIPLCKLTLEKIVAS